MLVLIILMVIAIMIIIAILIFSIAFRVPPKESQIYRNRQVWMAETRFGQAAYKEAFADFASARKLLSLRPEVRPSQQDS